MLAINFPWLFLSWEFAVSDYTLIVIPEHYVVGGSFLDWKQVLQIVMIIEVILDEADSSQSHILLHKHQFLVVSHRSTFCSLKTFHYFLHPILWALKAMLSVYECKLILAIPFCSYVEGNQNHHVLAMQTIILQFLTTDFVQWTSND